MPTSHSNLRWSSSWKRASSACLWAASILLLVLLSGAPESSAETSQITGTAGADGERGASGPPAENGTDGQDGGDALAIADAVGESNTARATGGDGGRGGAGGSAPRFSDADGGDGGSGGDGGDADARAFTEDEAEAIAIARGGRRGFIGTRGLSDPPGVPGLEGPAGGSGGSASATASVTNEFGPTSASDRMQSTATATAESGAPGRITGGSGGDAFAEATGVATGTGSAEAQHEVQATANARTGDRLADDGNAEAKATGSTSFGHLRVGAEATAPDFFSAESSPGLGGNADAHASGIHSGAGSLVVEALAGVGSSGSEAGEGAVSAEGHATAGADVEVSATIESAGPILLRDAVSGSTSGTLSLTQRAVSNRNSGNRLGGDVTTALDATNTGGGELNVEVQAFGGNARSDEETGGDATVESVIATGAQNVLVDVDAFAGNDASATIGSVRGISTGGGDVDASARLSTHEDGSTRFEDLVGGETSGNLNLVQQVESSAGAFDSNGARNQTESVLNVDTSASTAEVGNFVEGSNAVAETDVENDAGSIMVLRSARGVRGFTENGGEGGDATTITRARSHGDGNEIRIGRGLVAGGQDAVGGNGAGSFGANPVGNGGRADGSAEAIASGDSRIEISTFAEGGDGGGFERDFGDGEGGNGGDANASGFARNAGNAPVTLDAIAQGGGGGRAFGEGRQGGQAGTATVSSVRGESTGGANIFIEAIARGGNGGEAGSDDAPAGKGGDAFVSGLSGSTAGTLRIDAVAQAGRGGSQSIDGVRGIADYGTARIDLDVENEGGGALELRSDVSASEGGVVLIDSMRGVSQTGADVLVDLSISAARAQFGAVPLGDSDAIEIENLVQGETTGVLELRQEFLGGTMSGPVTNTLNRSGSHAGLYLASELVVTGSGEVSGAGESNAFAENDSGWAAASAIAQSNGESTAANARAAGVGAGETRADAESSSGFRRNDAPDTDVLAHAIALSEDSGTEGSGAATAHSNASNRHSGRVSSIAEARNTSAESVEAIARVAVNGRMAAEGITARANGTSSGGGDVRAAAAIDKTAESYPERSATTLRNAVSGSTSGTLTLFQEIRSESGEISTDLVTENAGGGDLEIIIDAEARASYDDFARLPVDAGDIVLGDIIGRSEEGRSVEIDVSASGYQIRQESLDDATQPSRILGVSNGGPVSVSARFTAGTDYDRTTADDRTVGANAQSIEIDNIVEGETSGDLVLFQEATGGHAADLEYRFGEPDEKVAGDGGHARSSLDKAGTFLSLDLTSNATGGDGGDVRVYSFPAFGGEGGGADTAVRAVNNAGTASANGSAQGGNGGFGANSSGQGGEATVQLHAETSGDGHAVRVGDALLDDEFVGALGGAGNGTSTDLGTPLGEGQAGRGGDAIFHAEGVALGNSEVDVYARARGGRGGEGDAYRSAPLTGEGGEGGNAIAGAEAMGAGTERVRAQAEARGGNGGRRLLAGGNGGGALAASRAEGLGLAESSAIAIGGEIGLPGAVAGNATARSESYGATALSRSAASTGSGGPIEVGVNVWRESIGASRTAAFALSRDDSISPGGANGFARITNAPFSQSIAEARGHHAELDALLSDPSSRASVETLAHWTAEETSEAAQQIVSLDITFEPQPLGFDLLLGIFETESTAGGFETLRFWVERNGESLGSEELFTSLAEANAYFDNLLQVGFAPPETTPSPFPGTQPPPTMLRAFFDVSTLAGQSIAFGIAAVVVPEPGTALLLGLGLVALSSGRASKRAR